MTKGPSPDEQAFLAAIKANPRDDTPKLVFADWLDEHDQSAKAAKWRLAVERHRLRKSASTERVIPAEPFALDWPAVEMPSGRFTLGMIFRVGGSKDVDSYVANLLGAEMTYFESCLYACFGKQAMPLVSEDSLWHESQRESPPRTLNQYLQERRRELLDAYLDSKLVTGRMQAVEFANEIVATAQATAREIIGDRSRPR